MAALFDLWCGLLPRTRLFCWLGWSLGLGLLACLCAFSSGAQQQERQRTALAQQRAAIDRQWRSLRQIAASMDMSRLASASKRVPFSPLDFQCSPVRLLHWQPSAQGGELALASSWEAVPQLFSRLAERGMRINRFSLVPQETELLLTLQLERLTDD
ncbi:MULTISPECIES: hypothetical protein [unclassified Citrobacter]|uniref:HofO family protein n=1 Tax=unclassified Citrobacter TaxID=2644389 RepID=UPI00257740BC|nr:MULTISPECIES: hypothetical protein [unclassified Citrobacter]MDM2967385.1 hypothetical protein [Citrobacter sp. CK199]MDM2976390.1 hypothetical protein [Citrobacter sp. CK200]